MQGVMGRGAAIKQVSSRCLTTDVRCARAPKKFIKKPSYKGKKAKRTGDGSSQTLPWQASTPRLTLKLPAPSPTQPLSGTQQQTGALDGQAADRLDGFPQQEMTGGLLDWDEAFVLSNASLRQQVAAKRQALFGRGWRQRDVRYYLLRRAKHAASHAALLAEAAPQLASARAAWQQLQAVQSSSTHQGSAPTHPPPPPPLAPIPRPRLKRQRGDGPFDDSLPRPATFFKLPARWRRRVLAERTVYLRSVLPAVTPFIIIQMYSCAPVLLCCTTSMVATQIQGMARVLDVHPNKAAQQIARVPSLGLVNPDHVLLTAASLTSRYALNYQHVVQCVASSSALLATSVPCLCESAQHIAHTLQCSESQSMSVLLNQPELLKSSTEQIAGVVQALEHVLGQQSATTQQQQQQQRSATPGQLPSLEQLMVNFKGPQRYDLTGVHSCLVAAPSLLLAQPDQLTQLAVMLCSDLGLAPKQAIQVMLQPGIASLAPGLLYNRLVSLSSCLEHHPTGAGTAIQMAHPSTIANTATAEVVTAADPVQQTDAARGLLPVEWVQHVLQTAPGLVLWTAVQTSMAVQAVQQCCEGEQQPVDVWQLMQAVRQVGGQQVDQQGGRSLEDHSLGRCLSHNPWLIWQVLEVFGQLQLQSSFAGLRTPSFGRAGRVTQSAVKPRVLFRAWTTAKSRAKADVSSTDSADHVLPLLPSGKQLPDASWCYPHPGSTATLIELLGASPGTPTATARALGQPTTRRTGRQQSVSPPTTGSDASVSSPRTSALPSAAAVRQGSTRQQVLMHVAASRVMTACLAALQARFKLSTTAGAWVLLMSQPGLLRAPHKAATKGNRQSGGVAGRWGVRQVVSYTWEEFQDVGGLIAQDVASDKVLQRLASRARDAERQLIARHLQPPPQPQPAVQVQVQPQGVVTPAVHAEGSAVQADSVPRQASGVKRQRGYILKRLP